MYNLHRIYACSKNHTNLFSPNDCKKNGEIIFKYFKDKYVKSQIYTEKIDETRNYLIEETKLMVWEIKK